MDIKWFDQQTDFLPGIETMVVLYHELIAFRRLHHHLVVNALENGGGNRPGQHGGFRRLENINVFRAEHDIYRGPFAETFVYAFELMPGKGYQLIFDHQSVQNIAFADKVGDKGVDRFVINVNRRPDLLDLPFAHHDDRIAQGECFFLIVSNIDKGDSERLMHFLQLHLHILAHLEVKSRQRFVQQEHFRFVHDSSGNRDTLLLSAGKGIHITVLIIGHSYHLEGLLHLFLDHDSRKFFQLQAESDVIEDIQMREKSVFLKYSINWTFMRGCLRNFFPRNGYYTLRSSLESGNQTQQCRLPATGRPQNGYKLALTDRQIHIIQYGLVSKEFRHMLHTNDAVRFLHRQIPLYQY